MNNTYAWRAEDRHGAGAVQAQGSAVMCVPAEPQPRVQRTLASAPDHLSTILWNAGTADTKANPECLDIYRLARARRTTALGRGRRRFSRSLSS